MGMMERVRDWFAPSRPRSVAPPAIRADFMRGNRGVVFGGWRPTLREAADDVGSSWDLAAARTIDLIQNSGWMAGALDQAVANTVGTGLRLKAMPENDLFGMSNAEAEAWAQTVEQRWSLWAEKPYECDTAAIPDGLCIVKGARPGIDGPYRIESVTHSYSRGGGFVTQLSLKQPGSGGGGDI